MMSSGAVRDMEEHYLPLERESGSGNQLLQEVKIKYQELIGD